jgi:hypothetical protein
MNASKTLLTVAAFQFCAVCAWALPTMIDYSHFTDHIGPNTLPGYTFGDKVQLTVFLDSTDPVGSSTISAAANQGGTTLALDYYYNPTLPELHNYTKLIDFDPALTGSWEIIPTDSTGTGPSAFTNAIADPELIPLVENLTVQGTPLGARVSWTHPNLDGFDVDVLAVGILDATTGKQVFNSNPLSVQTTNYGPPAGVLQVGVDYVYGIILADRAGGRLENVSRTFSEPFRYTIAGDFNTDGTVDAADYVYWRKNLSGEQAMYDAWRENFGTSLGPGSGAALPSAAPLSAAVPEPATFALAALLLLGLSIFAGRYQDN